MDDGTKIEVRLQRERSPEGGRLRIDFSGTGPESPGNLNANPGIVTAAVMYCIRCAIADTMPLNAGVLRAVDLHIPSGILDPHGVGPREEWPAVAGGNVETSQRVVDCLLGALGLAAASQGTMNNFLFGNQRFGYYETLGGGTGGTANAAGEHAVHSHMTNTRLTDVEILESRYPVRLVRFSIRRGSGGDGAHRGGDGMVRQIQALEPLEVSLVTSRRAPYAPFGLEGGKPGASGENLLVRADGRVEPLGGSCQLRLEVGESIVIQTPGGGGYGEASDDGSIGARRRSS
jgi:5-oxoprolinase (ATP-hydrolysing)